MSTAEAQAVVDRLGTDASPTREELYISLIRVMAQVGHCRAILEAMKDELDGLSDISDPDVEEMIEGSRYYIDALSSALQ